jgi:hypothetical protein
MGGTSLKGGVPLNQVKQKYGYLKVAFDVILIITFQSQKCFNINNWNGNWKVGYIFDYS